MMSHLLSEYAILPVDTAHDIQYFVREIVDSINIRDDTTRENVFEKLSTGCQGMLLWVRLEGERLEPGMSASELQEVISSMSSDLDHA